MRIDDVITATNDLIRRHGEVTVRQVYYHIYPTYHSEYKNAQSFYTSFDKMLVKARERNLVPVDRVIDTARTTMGGDYRSTDPDEYLEDQIEAFLDTPESYYLKRWENQPVTPVVWIEKDALSRIVHSVAREYRVMTCPSRGYSSMHYLWKFCDRENIKILHFADHDPSGLDMTRDLRKRISIYSDYRVPVERIALTYEQVKEHDLIPNPTKRETRRRGYVEQYGDECWELDALPPDVLKELVRDSIENEIVVETWENTEEQEKKDREKLRKIIGKVEEDLKNLTS